MRTIRLPYRPCLRLFDPPLDPKNIQKIVEAEVDWDVFLKGAGNLDFFMRAGFSLGTSVKLSELAKGFAIATGKFYLSYHIQSIRP